MSLVLKLWQVFKHERPWVIGQWQCLAELKMGRLFTDRALESDGQLEVDESSGMLGGGGSSFVLCFAPILFQPVFTEVRHIPFQELLLTPSSKLSLFQCVCCFNTAMQESCLPVAHVHIPVYLQQCLPQPPPLSLLHARRIIRQYEGAQSCLLLTSVSSYCYYVYPWPLHHVSKFASSLKKEKSTNVLCRTRLRISSPLFFFFLVSHFVNHSNCS